MNHVSTPLDVRMLSDEYDLYNLRGRISYEAEQVIDSFLAEDGEDVEDRIFTIQSHVRLTLLRD